MQIYGSGLKGYANTALVDDTGHLYTISTISGTPTVSISGGIHIGSVSASVDSIYIQSGANIIGSMGITHIDDPETIGSHAGIIPISGAITVSGTFTVTGSVYTTGSIRIENLYEGSQVYQGTSPWVVSGTSTISGLISVSGIFHDILGSVSVQQDSIPWIISGAISNLDEVVVTVGSEAVVTAGSIQTYDPLGVGSVVISGTSIPVFRGIGSVHLVPGSLEVYQTTASDMQVSGIVTISGIFHDVLGSVAVTQDTIPWIVSGTSTVSGIFHDMIGSVYVSQIVPGTAATNLGKAIDDPVGATDTGILMLAKHNSDTVHLTTAEDDYDTLNLSNFGALQTEPEQHHIIDNMGATAGWTALGNDTLNLATTTKHVLGTNALTFDKVNGAANTIFAGIDKTITSVDFGVPSPHDLLQTAVYLSDVTNVNYIFVRLGTDSSNYNEWRISADDLVGGDFEILIFNLGDASHTGITGNGWNPSAVTYAVVGVAFDAETNTLSDIIFDELSFHTNQHTSASIGAEVSTSVSSPNVSIKKWGAKNVTNATALADNTSVPTAAPMGAFGMWYDGANWDRARGDSTDGLLVNLGTNNDLTIGSVSIHGVGSVQLVPGSLEVYQGTASKLQVSGTLDVDVISAKVPISGVVNQGTDPWVVSGTSTVTGSIYTTGSIRVANLYEGSEVYIVTDPVPISGIVNQGTAPWEVSGTSTISADTDSIFGISGTVVGVSGIVNLGTQWTGVGSVVISGTVPVTGEFSVGSESVITAGSVEVYQDTITDLNATISGTVSANILTDPVPISGIVNQGTAPWEVSGTATISADADSVFGISGTVVGVSGIVNIGTNPVPMLGSVKILSSTGSLEVYQTTNADMQVQATQETSPWVVSGTSTISGVISNRVAGSIVNMPTVTVDASNLDIRDLTFASDKVTTSGTATISAGANSVFGVSGTLVGVSGIVNQGTNPWVISGVVNVGSIVGSIAVSNFAALGSDRVITNITPIETEQTRGVFGISGTTFIASGLGKNLISPGAGSKIFLKGFNASAETPSQFRIMFSGTTLGLINTFSLPGSGTVAMNLLGMEPSGAINQPIAVGMFNAGSLHFTAFTKDSL